MSFVRDTDHFLQERGCSAANTGRSEFKVFKQEFRRSGWRELARETQQAHADRARLYHAFGHRPSKATHNSVFLDGDYGTSGGGLSDGVFVQRPDGGHVDNGGANAVLF